VAGACATAVLVVTAACGSDDDGSRDDIGGVDPEQRDQDQPLASESTSVRPYVQGLLDEHSAAVDEILANPELARDDDSPVVTDYVEVYEPDSEVPDQVLATWVDMAERGERARPAEDGMPMNVLRVDGELEVVAEDEVRFPVCDEQRLVVEDADGEVVDELTYEPLRGQATAVHVDGRWYLRRIDLAPDPMPSCATDGDEAESDDSAEDSGGADEGGDAAGGAAETETNGQRATDPEQGE
jgi:hypothetical protein